MLFATARAVRLGPCRTELSRRQKGGRKRNAPANQAARTPQTVASDRRDKPAVKDVSIGGPPPELSRLEVLYRSSTDSPGAGADETRGELVIQEPSTSSQAEKKESWLGGLVSVTPRTKGLILLNILTFLYGSNIPMVKDAQEVSDFGPWLFNAIRFGIAALVFTPWIPKALAKPELAKNAIQLGSVAAGAYGLQAYGLLTTEASRCSFLASFTVILVPLLAGLDGKQVSSRTWIATAVAFLGVAVLELAGGHADAEGGLAGAITIGDCASLGSAALFSFLLYRTEALSSSLRGEGNSTLITSLQLSTLAVFFAVMAAGEAVLSGAIGPSMTAPSLADATAFAQALPWRDILWTGLISTAGTLWIEVEALRYVSSTDAALVYTTEPVWGAVLSWVILGEVMTGGSYAGAALILCGSLIGQSGGGGGHGGPEGEAEVEVKEKTA